MNVAQPTLTVRPGMKAGVAVRAEAPTLAHAPWAGPYRVGGLARFVLVAVMLAGGAAFMISPPPTGPVTEWFALFQRNWLLGMMDLDLAMLVSNLALIPVVAALSLSLRRTSPSAVVLAASAWGMGIALYLSSSRVLEMLALSRQYAVAATAAQRASVEAAGQSMLTSYLGSFAGPVTLPGWNLQGTAFNLGYALCAVAGVVVCAVMLRSEAFGRVMAWLGIAAFAVGLGLFLPGVGVTFSMVLVLLELVWFALVGRRLLQLARRQSGQAS